MNTPILESLIAAITIGVAMSALGVGIIFFGRKSLGAECGTVPTDEACMSKEVGICPLDDDMGALKAATTVSRAGSKHPRH